jgi:transposase
LRTHPGVGPLAVLAFVLMIGKADRFQCGKQIASYLGLVPLEKSSGNQRRLDSLKTLEKWYFELVGHGDFTSVGLSRDRLERGISWGKANSGPAPG